LRPRAPPAPASLLFFGPPPPARLVLDAPFVLAFASGCLQDRVVYDHRVDRQDHRRLVAPRARQAEDHACREHRMQRNRPADGRDGWPQGAAHRLRSSSSSARTAFGSVRNPILVAPACCKSTMPRTTLPYRTRSSAFTSTGVSGSRSSTAPARRATSASLAGICSLPPDFTA